MKSISLLTVFLVMATFAKADNTANYSSAVNANNTFGFNFYNAVRNGDHKKVENRFISPVSAYFALSMLSNGAKGSTQDAINKTIDVTGMDRDTLNQQNQSLITTLNTQPVYDQKNPVKIAIANSIWTDKAFPIKASYVDSVEQYYSGVPAS